MSHQAPWGTRFLAILVLLACGLFAAPTLRAGELDDSARVMAGYGGLKSVRTDEAFWKTYSQEVSNYWREYERRIGKPMRQWGCQELGRAEGITVFYPFAGPDLPAAYQLFPDADRYVLLSMQRGEPPPRFDALSKGELDEYLASFRRAWKFYGALGFFRTDDLDAVGKAAEGRPIGVSGALMAFAVRLGFEVESVEPIFLDLNENELKPRGALDRRDSWDSVRLTLRRDGRTVIVDHVRVDLSNASLSRTPGPRAWLERMAANPTLLKAASHHPQEPEFSIFRDVVLANAPVIVQDETGIDYAKLAENYNVRLYGRFTRPNSSFDQSMQRSLAAAYQKGSAKPLPFRTGYEKDAGSAIQVAERPAGGFRARKCIAGT